MTDRSSPYRFLYEQLDDLDEPTVEDLADILQDLLYLLAEDELEEMAE